jgi:hypothetical protein
MNEELLTDAVLREFLLGRLDDEERARIESLFLTDSEARENVLVIEQELIEDYLEDNLPAEDKQEFLLRYGQTAAQWQQLRITEAIKNWALKENAAVQTVPTEVSTWDRLRTRLWLRPAFVIPIAVAAMVAIIVAGIWLNSRMKRAALEQELTQLNTPESLREVPAQTVLLELSPIVVRSAQPQAELKKSADTRLVELHLPWVQKERYATYRAEVHRVGGGELLSIPNLKAETDGRYQIRARLPAYIFTRGQYLVKLSGIEPVGASGITEEYTFTVDD